MLVTIISCLWLVRRPLISSSLPQGDRGARGGCMHFAGSMFAGAVNFWGWSGKTRRLIGEMTCECSGDAEQL